MATLDEIYRNVSKLPVMLVNKTGGDEFDLLIPPDPLTMLEIEYYENGQAKRIVFREDNAQQGEKGDSDA